MNKTKHTLIKTILVSLTLILTTGFYSCKSNESGDGNNPPSNTSDTSNVPKAGETTDAVQKETNFTIAPGKVGSVTKKTKKSDLADLFGAENVTEGVVFSVEGQDVIGTIVKMENEANNFSIEWKEGDDPKPKIIRISGEKSDWITDSGVKVGSTLEKVQNANGKPFEMYGFEIDRYLAGMVQNWKNGQMNGVGIQFNVTNKLPEEEYSQILGDGPFTSDNALMRKAGTVVTEISMIF